MNLCLGLSPMFVLFLAVSKHFLGPVAKSFARRLTCQGGPTITYLPASHFDNIRKYIHYHLHVYIFRHLCTLHSRMSHKSFLLDGRYTGMTMLLIPLHVLSVIGLYPSTCVLGITKVSLECTMKMWVDDTTDRCRAFQKSIAPSGKTKKKELYGPCLGACKHYCLWALLPDRVH